MAVLNIWMLFALLLCSSAQAAEWRVQPGESIATRIAQAQAGDVILIERGDYHEHLIIDKALTLRGLNRPTVLGDYRDSVIRIKAADVIIEGLIVRNSGANLTEQNAGIYVEPGAHRTIIRNSDITYCLFGLWIEKANDVQVTGNLITGLRDVQSPLRGNGIQLYNTTGARIIDNNISFTRDGIYVDVSHQALFRGNRMHHLRYGSHYMNSYHNIWEGNESYLNRSGLALMEVRDQIVRNNIAWGNSDHGIMLRTIQDSVIENNIVIDNGKGFFIYDAEYNTLRGNLVMGNVIGAHVAAGSYRNEVDGNDFIGNHEQLRYVASRDVEWGKQQGNYWSNYSGWDQDGDGTGDLPYAAIDLVDRLTWSHPAIKLLLSSPAIQVLRGAARQFPLLRAPSIVDNAPHMRPHHTDWSRWLEHTQR